MTVGAFWHGAFSPTVFYCDPVFQPYDDRTDGHLPKPYRKRPSRKERERALDLALAKAFEPKRGPKRPPVEPWHAEPVLLPDPQAIPEFNPQIAGLSNYVADLQRQLAQRKFELSQMEADDELLLLSL